MLGHHAWSLCLIIVLDHLHLLRCVPLLFGDPLNLVKIGPAAGNFLGRDALHILEVQLPFPIGIPPLW